MMWWQKLLVKSPTDMLMVDALEWLPWRQFSHFWWILGDIYYQFHLTWWHVIPQDAVKNPALEHHSTPNLPMVSQTSLRWALPLESNTRHPDRRLCLRGCGPDFNKTGDEGLDVVAFVVKTRRRRTEITHFCSRSLDGSLGCCLFFFGGFMYVKHACRHKARCRKEARTWGQILFRCIKWVHVINNFVYAYVHFMLCRGVSVYVSYMHICLNHVFMYDKYRHSKK